MTWNPVTVAMTVVAVYILLGIVFDVWLGKRPSGSTLLDRPRHILTWPLTTLRWPEERPLSPRMRARRARERLADIEAWFVGTGLAVRRDRDGVCVECGDVKYVIRALSAREQRTFGGKLEEVCIVAERYQTIEPDEPEWEAAGGNRITLSWTDAAHWEAVNSALWMIEQDLLSQTDEETP